MKKILVVIDLKDDEKQMFGSLTHQNLSELQ